MQQRLRFVFDKADKDGDGFVDCDEFKNYLGLAEADHEAANKIFTAIDSNGDGKLSFDEFRQYLLSV